MNSFDQAKALLTYSKDLYTTIDASYQKSIEEQEVDVSLKIGIKNFMENVRSALDYTAKGLHTKYGIPTSKNIYFPYAWVGQSEVGYRNRINSKIPGINNNPDVIDKLCDYQYFAHSQNYWMPLFMELNNENKHEKLSPQYKEVKNKLDICVNNIPVTSFSGDGSSKLILTNCTFSSIDFDGVQKSVHIDYQELSPNKPMDIENENLQQYVYTITSFYFTNNKQHVMRLLYDTLSGVSKIVEELSIL
jgi:hypothetical protein